MIASVKYLASCTVSITLYTIIINSAQKHLLKIFYVPNSIAVLGGVVLAFGNLVDNFDR
jgi:hypothetical protein